VATSANTVRPTNHVDIISHCVPIERFICTDSIRRHASVYAFRLSANIRGSGEEVTPEPRGRLASLDKRFAWQHELMDTTLSALALSKHAFQDAAQLLLTAQRQHAQAPTNLRFAAALNPAVIAAAIVTNLSGP